MLVKSPANYLKDLFRNLLLPFPDVAVLFNSTALLEIRDNCYSLRQGLQACLARNSGKNGFPDFQSRLLPTSFSTSSRSNCAASSGTGRISSFTGSLPCHTHTCAGRPLFARKLLWMKGGEKKSRVLYSSKDHKSSVQTQLHQSCSLAGWHCARPADSTEVRCSRFRSLFLTPSSGEAGTLCQLFLSFASEESIPLSWTARAT